MEIVSEIRITGKPVPAAYSVESIVAVHSMLKLPELADAVGSTLTPGQVDAMVDRIDAALKDLSKRAHAELDRLMEVAEIRARAERAEQAREQF